MVRRCRVNDEQATAVIDAVLHLALTVRDEVGPGVTEAAQAVLDAAAGDPIAAVTIAAALVRADLPVDAWWTPAAAVRAAALAHLSHRPDEKTVSLAPCGTHSAFNRHRVAREPIDEACRLGERAYQRERAQRRRAAYTAADRARLAERQRACRAARKGRAA